MNKKDMDIDKLCLAVVLSEIGIFAVAISVLIWFF